VLLQQEYKHVSIVYTLHTHRFM